MLVREFRLGDLNEFTPNKYSIYDDYVEIFYDENCLKYSLIYKNKVECIICFTPYWKNNWLGFILYAENFNMRCFVKVREFMQKCIAIIKPDRLQTDSIDHPVVNEMHKFLGMKLEGTRKKYIYGQDINMWAMVWE